MKFGDFHRCRCFDVKYVMGFLYGCCTHVFTPLIAKNARFVKNEKLGFILGIWGFWWIASFDLKWFMGCSVCMLATCSLSFIFKIFTFGYACWFIFWGWFIRQSCSSWNLGFCWIGYNCLKLTTLVSLMDGSDWVYTRCTMYTVGLHVFQITWLYGSMNMFMYIHKIFHFNAFIHWRLLCINLMQSFCHAYVHCVYVSLT